MNAHTRYDVTKQELVRQTRALWEEAWKADPHRTEENTHAVLGRDVFVWDLLAVVQLTALRRALFPTVLAARAS